jgi:hypothetical protein
VHGIEHAGVCFEASAQALSRSGRIAFCETVERLVVKLFGSGGVSGHDRNGLTS